MDRGLVLPNKGVEENGVLCEVHLASRINKCRTREEQYKADVSKILSSPVWLDGGQPSCSG